MIMKFVGSISSLVAGVFTFIFFSIAHMSMGSLSSNGWDLIQQSSSGAPNGFVLYKIFGIASIAIACVLIIMGIMLLLKDLNVLKVKFNLNFLNNIMLTVFCLCVVLAFIGDVVMCSESSYVNVGAGMWLLLAFSVVACLLGWLLTRKEK